MRRTTTTRTVQTCNYLFYAEIIISSGIVEDEEVVAFTTTKKRLSPFFVRDCRRHYYSTAAYSFTLGMAKNADDDEDMNTEVDDELLFVGATMMCRP